ncbi:MAG: hypothetical protein QXK37_05330 [Candidatus Woesearchaeota archaeon]
MVSKLTKEGFSMRINAVKKLVVFFVICLFSISTAFAAGKSISGSQQGIQEPDIGDEDKSEGGVQESGTEAQEPGSMESGQGKGQGLERNTETETKNKGEESSIKTQDQSQINNPEIGKQVNMQTQEAKQIQTGSHMLEGGKQIEIQTQDNNQLKLKSGNVEARTSMKMLQEQTQSGTKLKVQLSNGKDTKVKVMPDTASEKAIERLRIKVCSAENGCSIELKEVGSGEQVKAAYEINAQKEARILGLFKTKMQVQAHVDAQNGEVIQTKKPWWAFLASEPKE